MLEYLENDADYLVRRATCVFKSESCQYCRLISTDIREQNCRMVDNVLILTLVFVLTNAVFRAVLECGHGWD